MTDPVAVREAHWPDDAATLRRLRSTVFVEEQNVPVDIEWDGRDKDARHVIVEGKGQALGCGRLLPDGRIGRLAVLAGERGTGYGALLLQELLRLARSQGLSSVHLHAQANAIAFYERAGFLARGERFMEAGIEHLDMRLLLDYRDHELPLKGVGFPQPFQQLVVAQARLARREIRILSPRLDTKIFNQNDLFDALRLLVRRGRQSRIQILVQDSRAVVQQSHGLLALARRLPSSMEMRSLPEHPNWGGDTLVMRDRDSLLALPAGENNPGFYRPGERARCEKELARFDELWRAGQVDPEFRALSI